VAEAAVEAAGAEGSSEADYYTGKIAAGEFFHARLLPLASTLAQRIDSGSAPLMSIRDAAL